RALGRFARDYPLTDTIFAPRYLERDARKVATVTVLDDQLLQSVFEEARLRSEASARFEHVVLSQHLAISRLATEVEEYEIWKDVVRFVARLHPGSRILLKPHPRD